MESKVKSHTRRTKDGKQTRVKEGKRKSSLGTKLKVAGGIAGAGLITAYGLKKNRDFKEANYWLDTAKALRERNTKIIGQVINDKRDRFNSEFKDQARGIVSNNRRYVKLAHNKARKLKSWNPFIKNQPFD
jgi:hypothetical protein